MQVILVLTLSIWGSQAFGLSFCERALSVLKTKIIYDFDKEYLTGKLKHEGWPFKKPRLLEVFALSAGAHSFPKPSEFKNPLIANSQNLPVPQENSATFSIWSASVYFKMEDGRLHRIHVRYGIGAPLSFDSLIEELSDLPEVLLSSIHAVTLLPQAPKGDRPGKCGYASQGGHITLYPWALSPSSPGLKYVLRHEAGHTLAEKLWKRSQPDSVWLRAQQLDQTSVSSYGDRNSEEDFAESVAHFFLQDHVLASPHKYRWGVLEAITFGEYR